MFRDLRPYSFSLPLEMKLASRSKYIDHFMWQSGGITLPACQLSRKDEVRKQFSSVQTDARELSNHVITEMHADVDTCDEHLREFLMLQRAHSKPPRSKRAQNFQL